MKNEFRLHRTVNKPEQLEDFFREWQTYLDQINMTARAQGSASAGSLDTSKTSESVFSFGKDLPQDLDLSEEQVEQLEKLRGEATKPGN